MKNKFNTGVKWSIGWMDEYSQHLRCAGMKMRINSKEIHTMEYTRFRIEFISYIKF